MNDKEKIVMFGNESIKPIAGGLYHASVEIDGKMYHSYGRNPLNGLQFIMNEKKSKGSGRISDLDISNMYDNSDVMINIKDGNYSVLLHIPNHDFLVQTYDKASCLLVLEALGAELSQRVVETYRASLARYAWSIINYGDNLHPESDDEDTYQGEPT